MPRQARDRSELFEIPTVARAQLIFYDPVNFTELGRVRTASAPTLLSPAIDQNSTWCVRTQANSVSFPQLFAEFSRACLGESSLAANNTLNWARFSAPHRAKQANSLIDFLKNGPGCLKTGAKQVRRKTWLALFLLPMDDHLPRQARDSRQAGLPFMRLWVNP